jgi:phosphoglucosamine mutase
MGKLFGTDGIRGPANEYPMTAEMALNIGRATAHLFKRKDRKPKIIIGKDTRLSGYMLEHALVAGICSVGADAFLTGPLPTPGVAFATGSMKADAGIVVSASHNHFRDNGIKIFSGRGLKLSDEMELEIEDLVSSDKAQELYSPSSGLGKVYRISDTADSYIEFLKTTFPKRYTLKGMKIVLDCANGAAYKVAPKTFLEMGADIVSLFDKPDGENINANCGSQHPEFLAKEVVRVKANAGFAFDGDGDRVIAVDEKGAVLTGDQIMALCAREMKEEGRLAHNLLVSTVMSNMGFRIALKELGIENIITDVGDRYVLEEMRSKGALIGGEQSGHVIFLEHHTAGDGIITALQVLAAMKKTEKTLSELARVMKVFPQKLVNIEVAAKIELSAVPEVNETIQDVEKQMGDAGRVLVRYSGTENLCRVMVEAPTEKDADKYCKQIADVVKEKLG